MAIQFSVAVRNAKLDAIATTMGASAILKLRTGAPPATCATADSGTACAQLNLPATYMAAASGGSKTLTGTWETTAALAAGTIGHYRIYASDGTTCHEQGTVTIAGGGGDMTLDNNVLAVNQDVKITTHTLTEGNA